MDNITVAGSKTEGHFKRNSTIFEEWTPHARAGG